MEDSRYVWICLKSIRLFVCSSTLRFRFTIKNGLRKECIQEYQYARIDSTDLMVPRPHVNFECATRANLRLCSQDLSSTCSPSQICLFPILKVISHWDDPMDTCTRKCFVASSQALLDILVDSMRIPVADRQEQTGIT